MAARAGGSKPLRLKDLLELDCESCSAAGFRCYPRRLCVAVAAAAAPAAASSPMRHLLDADRSSSSMRRPKLSSLSKSLSRRLRGGFWRRREEEQAAAPASSTVPAVTSCCCSSDSETSESSNSTGRKSHYLYEYSEFSSASSDSLHAGGASTTVAVHEVMKRESKEEEEAAGGRSSEEADEKEQLSPVGVMDFPFDEDDDDAIVGEEEEWVAAGACTPSFNDSLAQLQRTKMQLQPKIRRLGNTGELSGVDLEARFAASESDRLAGVVPVQFQCSTDVMAPQPRHNDHRSDGVCEKDPDEYSLLDLLADTVLVGVVDDVTERLLLDCFVEAKCSPQHIELRVPTNLSHESRRRENGEMLRLAKAWLEGTATLWSLNDVLSHGEDVMAEMERSRRWMHTGEEVRQAGVAVAAMVMEELLHELVSDLIA